LTCFFCITSWFPYRWIFRLWLTFSVSPLSCHIDEPFNFDLLLPYSPFGYRIDDSLGFDLFFFSYHLSITASMILSALTWFFLITSWLLHQWAFRLWLVASVSSLGYHINKPFDFDLLPLYHLSITASMYLSTLTCFFCITFRLSHQWAI